MNPSKKIIITFYAELDKEWGFECKIQVEVYACSYDHLSYSEKKHEQERLLLEHLKNNDFVSGKRWGFWCNVRTSQIKTFRLMEGDYE